MAQEKKTYNIGILTDFITPESEPLFEKLRTEIIAVVGEDAIIAYPASSLLVNDFDPTKAEAQYNQLLENDTDIILAFGLVNNELITKQTAHRKPTILFGALSQDFAKMDMAKTSSGIENFTYIVRSQSFLEDLGKFKELTNYKNLGFAIDRSYVENLPVESTVSNILKDLDAEYRLIPFDNVNDITSNLEGIDGLYLAGGFFLDEAAIMQLAQALIEKKIPSFSVNGVANVRAGMLGTYQTEESIEQFFRRIALSVEAYINGTSLADLPVYLDTDPRLSMNYQTAQLVGVPIKLSLIAETDFIGDIEKSLAETQYDILDVIGLALQNNLNIKSIEKDVELSTQDVRSAKTNYLPNVTAAASGTYTDPDAAENSFGQSSEFQTAGNITLQQTIFSEAANANISIQKQLLKAQEENLNTEQLNIIFDAAGAYFDILNLKANALIQIRNLDLTKYNLRIAQQNFEAGESGKTDLLRFRSQMAQNTQTMIEAINQLQQGFISLNQLLNNSLQADIDIIDVTLDEGVFERYNYKQFAELLDDPTLREPFIEFLTIEAKNNAPELKSLNYNLSATERSIRLNSGGRFLPTLALQGQYNRIFDRSGVGSTPPQGVTFLDDNYSVNLNVSIPIINQNTNNVNRQIGIIQKEQLTINKENTELAIDANVRNTVLELINQVSNIELSQISEETARETLDLTQNSYSEGAVNIIQLIDAQNNYLNAQLARATAIYNFLRVSLLLERSIGYYFLLNSPEDNAEFVSRFLEYTSNRD